MKSFLAPIVLATTALLASGTALAQSGMPVLHEFVVRIPPQQDINAIVNDHNTQIVMGYAQRGLYLLRSIPGTPQEDDQILRDALGNDGRLISREQNYENAAEDGHTQSFFVGIVRDGFINQPALPHIGLPKAPTRWTGQGITVAVLDTGVTPHFEYWASLRTDGANFINVNSPTSDFGTNVDSNQNGQVDELVGHGTFMAGLISHLAPGCEILPVKVLDSDGVGTSFAVAAGVYFALDRGADVINLSLSSPADSLIVREAVTEALAAGVTVVASVSNSDLNAPRYPAAQSGVVAVASGDLNDRRLPNSDFGPYVKFTAPGLDVVSTFPGNLYASASGTSVSTALVSGSLARMRSRLPGVPGQITTQALWHASSRIDQVNPSYMGQVGRGLRMGGAFLKADPVTSTIIIGR